MSILIAAALALAPAPEPSLLADGPLRPDDARMLCDWLTRAQTSAAAGANLETILRDAGQPITIGHCRIGPQDQGVLDCHRNLAPYPPSMMRTLRACDPAATEIPRPQSRLAHRVATMETRALRFDFSWHCNGRCRAGRILGTTITLRRRGQ